MVLQFDCFEAVHQSGWSRLVVGISQSERDLTGSVTSHLARERLFEVYSNFIHQSLQRKRTQDLGGISVNQKVMDYFL